MRASRVGFPCDRCLWYSVNGYAEKVTEKSKRIFATGTILESLIVAWLREDGWTVKYNPGSQDADLALSISVKGGSIGGHPDCFISRPGHENVLADIKTMSEHSFTKWKRNGSESDKPQYVDQVHVYADAAMRIGLPVERLAIVGVNKNNSAMHIDFFDFEPERMSSIIKRTENVFAATEPPAPGDRMEDWCCKYCGYVDVCELGQEKLKDIQVGDGVMGTNDDNIINAMELLKEARELSKTGKELEDEAKAVLDVQVRQQGIKTVRGGSLILTLIETISSRFDSTAFKKAHPDMVEGFMKAIPIVRYDIKEAI